MLWTLTPVPHGGRERDLTLMQQQKVVPLASSPPPTSWQLLKRWQNNLTHCGPHHVYYDNHFYVVHFSLFILKLFGDGCYKVGGAGHMSTILSPLMNSLSNWRHNSAVSFDP